MIDDPLVQLIMQITGVSDGWEIQTEYNIAPTQQVSVLTHGGEHWDLRQMRWWLTPSWSDGPSTRYSMFNAKSETLSKSRAYRDPFKRRRCIVPASGYYEWRRESGQKLPYYIEPEGDAGFAFAGLWDRWEGDGDVIESCTIITAAAPESMQHIHHRIPVHLTIEQTAQWVSQTTSIDTLNTLMAPEMRMRIAITPVSTVVNNARNKDARCIEPLGPSQIV